MTEVWNDVSWVKSQWMECEKELAFVKAQRDRYRVALETINWPRTGMPPMSQEERIVVEKALEGKE